MTLKELQDKLSPRMLKKISCEDLKELIDIINPAIKSRERKAFHAAKRIKLNGTVCSPQMFYKFDDYKASSEYLSEEPKDE